MVAMLDGILSDSDYEYCVIIFDNTKVKYNTAQT